MRLKTYFDIKWLGLAVTLAAIVILLTHIPQKFMPSELQEGSFDKFLHILAYGAITFILILSVKSVPSLHSASLVLFALLAIGIVDEITQPLVNRQASLDDLIADIIGISSVLLFSIFGKSKFEKIKAESVSKLCFTAAVAFIAGILAVPATFISLSVLQGPSLQQQQKEARLFFYKTMLELFEDTYNPEEGSISQDALETFKKYETRLGNACRLGIGYASSGSFFGDAFFPSGDIFHVIIVRKGKRFIIKSIKPGNWEEEWMEIMSDSDLHSIE